MKSKHDILRSVWGHEQFRPQQEAIIDSCLSGEDVVALLPTGGGKSICYQLPALLKDGVCLVVSPLISLIHDQCEGLRRRGIKAIAITSSLSKRSLDIQLENAINDPKVKFLYVSPERLKTRLFIERFKRMKVSLIAIDEAHCISQWGYNFRPAYLDIAEIRTIHPDVPLMALTATATARVLEDIQERLKIKEGCVYRNSYERPNLKLVVERSENIAKSIVEFLHNHRQDSGIIYCGTRKSCKDLSAHLEHQGFSVDFYHGGLSQEDRLKRQKAWQDGQTKVIVATNAFGMGIDKADVRFVLHYQLPENLESYSQEAGRAGRDGNASAAYLFYNQGEVERLKQRIANKFPEVAEIKSIYERICSQLQIAIGAGKEERYPFHLADFAVERDIPVLTAFNAAKFLELAGFIELNDAKGAGSYFRFTASADELYGFRTQSQLNDQVVQFILRTHIGVLEDMVRLNEVMIMRKLNLAKKQLREVLLKIDQLDLGIYEEESKNGSIYFPIERLSSDNMSFPREIYSQQKALHFEMLEQLIDYLDSTCKSKFIANYFGETDADDCGNCDWCVGNSIDENLENRILSQLNDSGILLDDLLINLGVQNKRAVLDLVRLLADDQKIKISEDGLSLS